VKESEWPADAGSRSLKKRNRGFTYCLGRAARARRTRVVQKHSMDDPALSVPDGSATRAFCPSCGAGLFGRYCAECGERSTGRADLRALAFLKDALYELTNTDSRIWRSLRSLVLQPGHLSEEYLAGRRRPWLGPVQLFLICNVAFFILLEFLPLHVFTTRLSDHLFGNEYGIWVLGMEARPGVTFRTLVQDQEAFGAYARTFNAVTAGLAKSLIFLMIPGVALLLHVLHARHRRYFVEHLVFATHLFAVVIMAIVAATITTVVFGRVLLLLGLRFSGDDDSFFGLVLLGVFVPWMLPGLRRFYGQSWGMAALKVPLFIVGFYYVLLAYRLMLFLLTIRLV
jgi:hypothetical protein